MHPRILVPLAALLLTACAPRVERCETEPWQTLLLDHYLRYPSLQLDDALKLLQQAATGSEHAVTDVAAARRWMREELMAMGPGPVEQVADTLGPGGRFARVNLRAWRARGGDPDLLADAFVATSTTPPDTAALDCALGVLQTLADAYRLPWGSDEVRAAVTRWSGEGHPAMHHSDTFVEHYQPAYRVVSVSRLTQLLATLPTEPSP
jgi:hypothetical protein